MFKITPSTTIRCSADSCSLEREQTTPNCDTAAARSLREPPRASPGFKGRQREHSKTPGTDRRSTEQKLKHSGMLLGIVTKGGLCEMFIGQMDAHKRQNFDVFPTTVTLASSGGGGDVTPTTERFAVGSLKLASLLKRAPKKQNIKRRPNFCSTPTSNMVRVVCAFRRVFCSPQRQRTKIGQRHFNRSIETKSYRAIRRLVSNTPVREHTLTLEM